MASVLVGVCPFVYMFSDHLIFLVLEHWMARNLLDKYCLWKVEEEVIKQKQSKRGMSSKSEAQDKALSVIRLRWDFFIIYSKLTCSKWLSVCMFGYALAWIPERPDVNIAVNWTDVWGVVNNNDNVKISSL